MPKVPTLIGQQIKNAPVGFSQQSVAAPQLNSVSVQGVNAVGASGVRLANQAIKIQDMEWQNANELRVREAENEIHNLRADLMHSDSRGALNTRGADAFATPESVFKEYDDTVKRMTSKLANDDQKGMFLTSSEDTRMIMDDQLQKHIAREGRVYRKNIIEKSILNSKADAEHNAIDDKKVQASIDKQAKAILRDSQLDGDSPTVYAYKKRLNESNTRKAVIERLLDEGFPKKAMAHLEKYKDKLIGDLPDKLKDLIDETTARGNALIAADEIWAKTKGNYNKAMEEVKKITDEKMRRRAESALKRKRTHAREKAAAYQRWIYKKALKTMENAGRYTDPRVAIKPSIWESYTPKMKRDLIKESRNPPTNLVLFRHFNKMTAEELRKIDPDDLRRSYRVNFSKDDKKKYDDKMYTVLNGPKSSNLTSESLERMMTAGFFLAGIDGSEHPKAFDALERDVRDKVYQYEMINLDGKRKASQKEMQDIVDDVRTEIVGIDRPWYQFWAPNDKPKSRGEVSDDDLNYVVIPIEQIAAHEKTDLLKVFRKAGNSDPSDFQLGRVEALKRIGEKSKDKNVRKKTRRYIRKILGE